MLRTSIQKIQKTLLGAVLCGSLGIAVSGAAHAQLTTDVPANKTFAVKLGAFFPSGKDVRRSAANTNLVIEGDYRLQVLPGSNSVVLASIGYITSNKDFQMVPLTLSQVFRNPNDNMRTMVYYGYGFGIYATKLNASDTSGKVKGLLGGFLVAGVDVGKSFFGEAKYHYISKYDNKFVGGLQTTIGYRF